jgi:predicted nucleotidyltransferase
MNDSEAILARLRALKPVLQKEYGITRLRVFGSVARGEARAESDVDLIADFEKKPGFIGFVGIKQDMEDALDKRVDLLTEMSIDKYLKKRILTEARDVW